MEQVQETFRMANAAFEKDNLEEAVSLWTHLKTLEPSPSNYFNRQAKDKLTRWGDDSRRAQYYFDKAEKMYGEERYEDARANYLMANRTDKTGRPGDAGIEGWRTAPPTSSTRPSTSPVPKRRKKCSGMSSDSFPRITGFMNWRGRNSTAIPDRSPKSDSPLDSPVPVA